MHVARLWYLAEPHSFAWLTVSLSVGLCPASVSDSACVSSSSLLQGVARHVLDTWAGVEDPLLQLARRSLTFHSSPATGSPPRDLAPIPFCPVSEVMERVNFKRKVLFCAQHPLLLVVAGLNWLHGVGLGARDPPVCYGPLSKVQGEASGLLAGEVSQLSHQCGRKFEVDWEQKQRARTLGYDGAEVYTAERLDLERICAAVPPAGVGGLVNAADVSTGFVRDALLDPSLVLKPNVSGRRTPPRPNDLGPRCGLAGACSGAREQKHQRTHRVQRHSRGQRPGGIGRSDGRRESWQRSQCWSPVSHHELHKVSNWAQNVIAGDMPQLPSDNCGVWSWRMGKLWFGPEKISNAVSTCSKNQNRGANGWPLQPPWPVVVFILAALGKSTSVRKLSHGVDFSHWSHPTRP